MSCFIKFIIFYFEIIKLNDMITDQGIYHDEEFEDNISEYCEQRNDNEIDFFDWKRHALISRRKRLLNIKNNK